MIKPTVEKDPYEDQITELLEILAILIIENPAGLSEHQLLRLLQEAPYSFFAHDALKNPLILFQTHFLLFHCLYRLKVIWRRQGRGLLEISALSIKLESNLVSHCSIQDNEHHKQQEKPEHTNMQKVRLSDPLELYYLDWSNFSSTKIHDVEALLTSFWKNVFIPLENGSIEQALSLMQLESPMPTQQLKLQYRRLAQQYHPDKGGDSEHFKKICQAFHQLKQHNRLA